MKSAGMLSGAGTLPIGKGSSDANINGHSRTLGALPRPNGSGTAEALYG